MTFLSCNTNTQQLALSEQFLKPGSRLLEHHSLSLNPGFGIFGLV